MTLRTRTHPITAQAEGTIPARQLAIAGRRRLLQAACAAGAAALLPAARACEFYASSLTVLHPWTRASAPGAATALVGLSFKDVTETDRLIGLQTPVAEGAELVGAAGGSALDLLIPRGQTLVLDEAGVQLRLVGLKTPLLMARTYPMVLLFAKGGALDTNLTVDYERFS